MTSKAGQTSTTTITFKRDEKQHCFETNGANIVVVGHRGDHTHGSSKVKLKNIVDYKWEQKNYPGRLIAVHMGGMIIAYSIKVSNREGMVRVVHIGKSQRALIKGMLGEVLDLQFAHIQSEVLLGCIEETALHIHKVQLSYDKIFCTLVLKITDVLQDHHPKYDRISWCPYVAESVDDTDDDSSKYLVWVRGNNFHCYSVNAVVASVGTGEFTSKDIETGCLKFTDNIDCITCAIYSPDGTTLAISSEDGMIRFYQVYFLGNDVNPRCLHQWKPHDGKVISSFFFLDNHTKECADNTLWKHAITCSDNNTEIKLWSCETWECKQTINFKACPSDDLMASTLCFKAEMDRTSSYLVLSDMQNRQLYVLQILKVSGDDDSLDILNGSNSGSDKNTSLAGSGKEEDEGGSGKKRGDSLSSATSSTAVAAAVKNTQCTAFIKSIAEFPLSSSILSFGIVDAAVRKYKCTMNDACLIDELDDYDDENNLVYCVIIHMFLVQPKSVQDAHVLYQPTLNESAEILSTISGDSEEANQMEKIADISLLSNKSAMSAPNISVNELVVPTNGNSPKQLNTSAPLNTSKNSSYHLVTPTSPTPHAGPVTSLIQKHSSQLNLMTPESFRSPIEATVKSPEVSQEVMSTLFMLANQQKKQISPGVQNKSLENALNLVNNKKIEDDQKLKKMIAHESLSSPHSNTDDLMANASGGSSPSREVQEILCLQDSNKYYDDTDEIILDEADGLLGVDELNDLENDINEDEESYNYKRSDENKDKISGQTKELVYNIAASEETTTTRSNSSKTEWPKVPDVTMIEQHVRLELEMPAGTPEKPANVGPGAQGGTVLPTALMNQVDTISMQMEKMFDIMQSQSSQMADLRNQIYELQKCRVADNQAMQSLARVDVKLLEQCFNTYDQQQTKKFDNMLQNRDKQNREVYQQMTDTLMRSLCSDVPRQLLPILAAKLDTMKQQMHQDISVKLSSTDTLLRDNLAKTCTNPMVLDRFGTAVTKAVQTGLENAFVETMNSRLIPSYEKATKEMMKQIHGTFSDATKEYTRQFAAYINQLSIAEDRSAEVLEAIRVLPDQIRVSHEKLIKACTAQITMEMNKDIKTLQTTLVRSLKDEMKAEIQKGFEEQASSLEDSIVSACVRSQAQTPAPSVYEVQETIKQLLASNQINRAFHTALLANDLHLVEFTLEKANFHKVFNPCPLEQTVLLSLIQQLSADMSNYNELKHKYLSDAILSLQLTDPITKEHSPKVLRELNLNCQTFITGHPTHPLYMSVKMLMVAIQGLSFKNF